MGTVVVPNSAAAALLSLQISMVQSMKGRKRMGVEEDWEETKMGQEEGGGGGGGGQQLLKLPCESEVPLDVLAHCFFHLSSFSDMASASIVSRKWREGMRQALACRVKLSFAGSRADDSAVGYMVEGAWSLRELNISLGRWGSRITDAGLIRISLARCCPNLKSISMWGVTSITDDGVMHLVSRAQSVEHLNVGGTFITDVSILAIAAHCSHLKVLNLWGCRHVTEAGLVALGKGCQKLSSINVWGMSILPSCELHLVRLNPNLQLKPSQLLLPLGITV